MKITQKILDRANEIYEQMFACELDLSAEDKAELLEVEIAADFEEMDKELSAGQYDAIEAALMESTGTIFGGLK